MEQFFTKLKRGMVFLLSWISAILLVAMSFLVIYQVFTRYVLNSPSDFTEEIVRYLLIWTGFMGAAYGFCTRQHMACLLYTSARTRVFRIRELPPADLEADISWMPA